MSTAALYDLREPTCWASPPATFSFSSLQALRTCPRRWQLLHSTWGPHSRFPERPHPAAIEGQIVHEALDILARELGLCGRPQIASDGFREAVARCGFWDFFASKVAEWNRRFASHPRAGPRYVLRTKPRDLANRAVCLFREQYKPAKGELRVARLAESTSGGPSPLSLLNARGSLPEVRLEHPSLPVVGVVDVVTLEQDRSTTVVDFKTGARKQGHKEQVLLYALLWWRVTGDQPRKVVVQYLESSWTMSPTEEDLVQTERVIADEIGQARDALTGRPAAARPGPECTWCPVRPRCNEGWSQAERTSFADGRATTVDVEVAVASDPTPNGFLGMRANGKEIAVVFDAAVGCDLPPFQNCDRFRIVDAAKRAEGEEIVLLPWTEMYRM